MIASFRSYLITPNEFPKKQLLEKIYNINCSVNSLKVIFSCLKFNRMIILSFEKKKRFDKKNDFCL